MSITRTMREVAIMIIIYTNIELKGEEVFLEREGSSYWFKLDKKGIRLVPG